MLALLKCLFYAENYCFQQGTINSLAEVSTQSRCCVEIRNKLHFEGKELKRYHDSRIIAQNVLTIEKR